MYGCHRFRFSNHHLGPYVDSRCEVINYQLYSTSTCLSDRLSDSSQPERLSLHSVPDRT